MGTATLREILTRQYERSWTKFGEAVRALTAGEWRTGEVGHLMPARIAYHFIETAEFYTGDTPDGSRPARLA